MEFWGAEVKPGPPLKVAPEEDKLIHISQATLDCKGKMGESVILTVTVDKKKFVIGTLSQEKFPQISFDLVFEKEFELSHNCTKGSVHFIGYRSPNIEQEEDDFFSGSDEEEEVPAAVPANGNAGAAASNVVKADSKPKAKPAEVKPESDDDEDDSDEEEESDDDDSEKGMDVDEDDSDDDEDSEDEEEEETPKKPETSNKKRPNKSASKTPVSGKKAEPAAAPAATPQKTEKKKKGGHTATPHPAKKGGKSPVHANQSPKSGGQSSGGNKKKKKQSKKVDKPVKSDRFPEAVEKKEVKTSADKKRPALPKPEPPKPEPIMPMAMPYCCGYDVYGGIGPTDYQGLYGSGPIDYKELWGNISSSSMNNDFNKVKTFDIRGVTETATK